LIYDVVIVGGGPVGLFLACELRLAGVTVLVLERLKETRTPLKMSYTGGRGLNLPSVEAFYRRGMLRAVRETAIGWVDPQSRRGMEITNTEKASLPAVPRFAGHFAGIVIDANNVDFSDEKYTVQGPSSAGGIVSLAGLEEVLAARAQELGVELRLGADVTDLSQTDDGVTVHVGDESIQAKWVVGCDGGRSTVRKRTGFEFVGTDPEFTGTIGMADFADPEKLQPGWNITSTGMYVNGPLPGRVGFIDFDGGVAAREDTVTLEVFQDALRRVSCTDVTVTALHVATCYTDNARQATTYRRDRILLAGDAAHVHSPLGGQGLNLGIGDAINLGWKLASVIKGWTTDSLLDTYTEERHPIGAWALEWTRAQVAILRPEPHARAMATIVRELINTRPGATFFAQKIAGTWLHYKLPGDHPLIGCSAPDLKFEDGGRLGALLHDGTALLLDLKGDESLRKISESWQERIRYVSAKVEDSLGLTAFFVRPDGFVAWATDGEPNPSEVAGILTCWLGEPSAAS